MIRLICGHTRLDKIVKEVLRSKIGMTSIEDKLREARLRWFGHIRKRNTDAPVRRCEMIDVRIIKGVEVGQRRVE